MDEMKRLLAALNDVNDEIDYENEKNLVDDGIIDSLTITRIIAAIGDEFDVYISTGDIEPENFNSVEAMLELIRKYQGK